MSGVSRRQLLLGGIGAALVGGTGGGYGLVQSGVLPGRVRLDRALGRCGEVPAVPAVTTPPLEHGTFFSNARGREVRWVLARPGVAAGAPLPVCLVLHGRGSRGLAAFDELHWHEHLAEAVAAGTPPYALVAADGGDGYWHRRADGDDASAMLLDELLPRLTERGLRTDRVGLTGWSMGGYGALLLAERLGPSRVPVVASLSAAVFRSYEEATPGAFDSPADFAAHDVLAGVHRLAGIDVRVDCGASDHLVAGNRALRAALGEPAGEIGAGCHDAAYWRRDATARLDFLGRGLASP